MFFRWASRLQRCNPSYFDKQYDGVWLPVRRFPVVQKDKLRPIDDLKENRVNDTFSTTERATLYAMDHIVWSAIFSLRSYKLGDGSVLEGYVHPDWISTKTGLKVTAMDLKSAYKQLPLSPLDYNKSVVSLWSPRDN